MLPDRSAPALDYGSTHLAQAGRGLADARRTVEDWMIDYNQNRPHSSLGNLTPEEFRVDYTQRLELAGFPL